MKKYTEKSFDNPHFAVVLGTDVNGLGHIRSLGAKGVRVFGVYSEKGDNSLGRWSRYCTPVHVPAGDNFEHDLTARLTAIGEASRHKPVLFATSDYYVDFISRHEAELKLLYLFTIPDGDVLKVVSNKRLIRRAAKRAGIETPGTFAVKSEADPPLAAASISYPCIVKPEDSYTGDFPGKLFVASDRDALTVFFAKYPGACSGTLIQEIIPGDEKNIYQCTGYIPEQGGQAHLFTIQKIHQYPPNFGITTLGRGLENPRLAELTRGLLGGLGYRGFFSVEYKQHAVTGKYYLIEVNPRLPWYNSLFTFSGVNFPHIQYQSLVNPGEEQDLSATRKEGLFWIYLRNEAAGYLKRRKAGEDITFRGYWKYLFRKKAFAYLDRSDPLPFVMALKEFFKWCLSKALG